MAETTEMFLTLLKSQEVWDQGASRVGVWWGLSSWVAVKTSSRCVLTWSFLSTCLCSESGRERVREITRQLFGVFPYKDTNLTLSGLHFYDLI